MSRVVDTFASYEKQSCMNFVDRNNRSARICLKAAICSYNGQIKRNKD